MKYLKYINLFEALNGFNHVKEVLNTIDDLCLDIKDDGFNISFGVMPRGLTRPNIANFDENINDYFLEQASLGEIVLYVKFDIISNFKNYKNRESLINLINTFVSVYKYLISEDVIISNFWFKKSTKYADIFNNYKDINELINRIDWDKRDKLNNRLPINMRTTNVAEVSPLDIRIAFLFDKN
jgi:hypothetical protein